MSSLKKKIAVFVVCLALPHTALAGGFKPKMWHSVVGTVFLGVSGAAVLKVPKYFFCPEYRKSFRTVDLPSQVKDAEDTQKVENKDQGLVDPDLHDLWVGK